MAGAVFLAAGAAFFAAAAFLAGAAFFAAGAAFLAGAFFAGVPFDVAADVRGVAVFVVPAEVTESPEDRVDRRPTTLRAAEAACPASDLRVLRAMGLWPPSSRDTCGGSHSVDGG